MSVTPIQGPNAVGPVKPTSRQPRDADFAAIFAGYTGAMIAGGSTTPADPRDAAAKETTARGERIDGEVADMRQAELDRPSMADRDSAGDDARIDADAMRRQARLESNELAANGATAKSRQSGPGQQPQPAQEFVTKFESHKTAIETTLRSDSASGGGSKNARQSGATESTSKTLTSVAETARSNDSASSRAAVQPAVANVSNTDGSRSDAARSIARMLARDFGGATGRDPSLQPVAVNRDSQSSNQTRSAHSQTGSANKPDTPARTDDETSARRGEFAKLMRNVRLNVGQKQSSATIQMNPPQLGRLRIDVRMIDQRLSVQVETQTPESRALMTERAGELIDALRAGGIEVEQFEITTVAQRDGLITTKAEQPRDTNDGAPQLKRTTRRNGDSGDDHEDTRTRNEGHDRGGLSLRA